MKTSIVGKPKGPIDVKRFYLPGVEIKEDCPSCGAHCDQDLDKQYMNYYFNERIVEFGYCQECDYVWERKFILEVTLRRVDDEL